jgi:hypothetical protein
MDLIPNQQFVMELASVEKRSASYASRSTITLDQVMGCIRGTQPMASDTLLNWLSQLHTQIQQIRLKFTENQNRENTTPHNQCNDLTTLIRNQDWNDQFKCFFVRELARVSPETTENWQEII